MRRSLLPLLVLSAGLTIAGTACGSDSSSSTTAASTTTKAASTTTKAASATSAASATTAASTTKAAPSSAASGSSGPVSSASAALCDARDELRTSITDLSKVNVVANGTSAISDQLTTIRANLADVRSAAGDDVKDEADAFEASLNSLQTALDQSGASMITDVVSALKDVSTTGATLLTSLENLSC